MLQPKLGLVVPCFNEGTRLIPDAFISYLRSYSNVTIVFVDDGSNDNTLSVVSSICSHTDQATHISLGKNQGKAEAVRRGIIKIMETEPDFIGYFDADLSTDLFVIDEMLKVMEENPPIRLVMGSRISKLGSSINRKWYRHLMGRLLATLIDSFHLRLRVYDTQCGAKIMRSQLARETCFKKFVTKWLFDVEIISRMISKNGRNITKKEIFELPLTKWTHRKNSKIGLIENIYIGIDFLKIFLNYR